MAAKQHHGPDRIGPAPTELHPLLGRQALGQDEQAIEEGHARQAARHPERHPRPELAQKSAQHRAQHEAAREGCADQAIGASPLLRLGDVGHVGVDGREAGRGDARDQPSCRQPPQVRRQRHQHIVGRQPGAADQDDGPAPILVRQRPDDRRGQELHTRPQGHEDPVQQPRPRIGSDELLDQMRQHRDDNPHGHDVQHRRDEDEGHCRTADLGVMQGHEGSRSWNVVLNGGRRSRDVIPVLPNHPLIPAEAGTQCFGRKRQPQISFRRQKSAREALAGSPPPRG
ncbi:hypothetical protein D3C72_1192370 [compost metagenome]